MQAGTDGSCYMAYVNNATTITVYKIVDTGSLAFTALGAAYTVTALVDGNTITLTIVGTTLTLYVNDIAQGTTRTDSTYATGQPGFGGFQNNTWIDNYIAVDL